MEQRRHSTRANKPFWASVVVQLAMFTMTTKIAADSVQDLEESLASVYVWSSWGSWGPCSKTCGGGVAVQERECLPRGWTMDSNSTTSIPLRMQRGDCPGVARRYHECNVNPCPEGEPDVRAEQCSAYDNRPFRGRFYNWIPYVDGSAPCMLNCRPMGQQFYASLGVVADGTPCTEPGYRAICIQGVCKVFAIV
ncbi:unnamed protein product, partial [Iphiclides podalirius]